MPDKLFMPTHPSSPFSQAYTRTHHQPDSSPSGLAQWACYIKASAGPEQAGPLPERYIQAKLFTSRKDTVHNLVYSWIHVPPSKISTAVKITCERIAPSKSFLGAMGGFIVSVYFTGHHWLLLAPSKLQSSQLGLSPSCKQPNLKT